MNAKLEHVMKDYIYFKKYNPEMIKPLEFYASRIYFGLIQKVNHDYEKLSKSDLNGAILFYENILMPQHENEKDYYNVQLNHIKEILKKTNER